MNIKNSRPRASGLPSTVVLAALRARVVAGGGDAADVPEIPFRILRPAEIAEIFGIHRATLYRLIADGVLPRPLCLDRHMQPT